MADEPVSAWRSPSPGGRDEWAAQPRSGGDGVGGDGGWRGRAEGGNTASRPGLTTISERPTTPRNAPSARPRWPSKRPTQPWREVEGDHRQAEAVSLFLVDAFRSPDPDRCTGTPPRSRWRMYWTGPAKKIDKEFAGSRATKEQQRKALALTYGVGLGLFDQAGEALHHREHLASASCNRAPTAMSLSSRPPPSLASKNRLWCADQVNRGHPALRGGDAQASRRPRLGLDHPDTLKSRNFLAHAYTDTGRMTESIPAAPSGDA